MSKSTLRQKVRTIFMGSDEKALHEAGFTYKTGNLTKDGRKVVLDFIFQNDTALRTEMVKVAEKICEDKCKKK